MKRMLLGACVILVVGCSAEGVRDSSVPGHWVAQKSGTEENLRGLSVVDQDVAWASGGGGVFLRTLDGGETWRSGTVPEAEDLDFRDVHAWDANRALLMSAGLPAKIFRTDNGGETWSQQYLNETPGVFFNAMAFWDALRGIAVGDPMEGRFLLIATEDGGKTWQELSWENRPQALPGEAGFAASGTCLTVEQGGRVWFGTGGPAARVFRSADWGATWSVVETPIRSGEASQGIFSLYFPSERNGIVVGGDYRDEPNPTACAAVTDDGGASWSLAVVLPAGFRECVTQISAHNSELLISVGPTGTDLSRDSGLSWEPVGKDGFHSVSFSPSGATGIAVGATGFVARWQPTIAD